MANITQFKSAFKKAVDWIKTAAKDEKTVFRALSHLDADGICSASILTNALINLDARFSLSVVKQLTEDVIMELQDEPYHYFILTDFGAGQLELIGKNLASKKVLILDHHSFDTSIKVPDNVVMINPHLFGIDGAKEISGAGVVYMFARELDLRNKSSSHLAIIGAIGDVQENDGFSELNSEIIGDASSAGTMEVANGLRWFGQETRPLVRLLTYDSEIVLPGLSGSESNSVQFLTSIGIPPKKGDDWTRFNDLTEEEKSILTSNIIMKNNGHRNLIAKRYILKKEDQSSLFRDAREFSTLLNACGRLDFASIGIGACLGDAESKKKASDILGEYRKEIIGAMRWLENNQDKVVKNDGFMIINAKDEIKPTLIGTMASIISNSHELRPGTMILSLARDSEEKTKVSIRLKGDSQVLDMMKIIKEILLTCPGEGGGHKNAAGAVIPTSSEDAFIAEALNVFKKMAMSS